MKYLIWIPGFFPLTLKYNYEDTTIVLLGIYAEIQMILLITILGSL